MNFKNNEKVLFLSLINRYLESPLVRSMKNYVQHGDTSTLEHCLNVAELSYLINKRFSLNSDEKVLITSAILHDFYLYDWHEKSSNHKLHGFYHPDKAAYNAKKYFDISADEEKAIRSHMWPLTVTKIPTSREAWIICVADKICALKETLGSGYVDKQIFC